MNSERQQLGVVLDEMFALAISTCRHHNDSFEYLRDVLSALVDYIGEFLTAIFVADRNLDFLELEVLEAFSRALTSDDPTHSQLLAQVAHWLKQRDDVDRPLTVIPQIYTYMIDSDRIDGRGRVAGLVSLSERLGFIAIDADGRSCQAEYEALSSNLRTLNLAMNWRVFMEEAEWGPCWDR